MKYMERMANTFIKKDFILFVFCGGMGTLTNFLCSVTISTWLDPTLSYALGYAISLYVAYALNAFLVFKERCRFDSFIRFVLSYIPNFLILFSFVFFLLNQMGWDRILVYALAGLLGLPVTYILVKIFAFGKMED